MLNKVIVTGVSLLLAVPALAEGTQRRQSWVSYDLLMAPSLQKYTYIFFGRVTAGENPCPEARVQIQVALPDKGEVVRYATTEADGSYMLEIPVEGSPEQSMEWKILAKKPTLGSQPIEVTGRSILMASHQRVLVERPIQLPQI